MGSKSDEEPKVGCFLIKWTKINEEMEKAQVFAEGGGTEKGGGRNGPNKVGRREEGEIGEKSREEGEKEKLACREEGEIGSKSRELVGRNWLRK